MRERAALWANLGAATAAVLLGASVVAVRVAVQEIPPLSLAVLRTGQGSLVLVGVLLLTAPHLLRVPRRSLPLLALLGVILFSLVTVLINAGLRLTEASRGALMLATMPMWSMWLGRVAARERLTARQAGGVVLTFLGVALTLAERGLVLSGDGRALLGDGLMLVTAFLGALYSVLSKRALVRHSAITVTTYAMTIGTLFLVPAAWAEGLWPAIRGLDGSLLGLVLFLGIGGGAAAFFLINWALSRLTPTQVTVYLNLNPMVATLLGALLLAERLTGVFLLSLGAVIGGVFLVNRRARLRTPGIVVAPARGTAP
ncbi:MAG: DMT family transporter [Acidimicrobiia bacterium]